MSKIGAKSKGRKRNASGRCVLCTEHVDNLTREHLFPKSWYIPELTTEKTIRQTFPSCSDCNSEHGKSELRLLETFGLSLNPEAGVASGIAKKVIHSFSMTEAPTEKEADIRGKKKFRLFQDMAQISGDRLNEDLPLVPGLKLTDDEMKQKTFMLTKVRESDIRRLIDKIVRGITYLEYQLYIETGQDINWQKGRIDIFSFAENDRHVFLPGLTVHFGPLPAKDFPALLFVIDIWSRIQFYVAVTPSKDPIWSDTIFGTREVKPLWDIDQAVYQ